MSATNTLNDELNGFEKLDPDQQARLLALAALDARLVRMAVEGDGESTHHLADEFERALEQAMDAEVPADAIAARESLRQVAAALREAGLKIRLDLSEIEVDGLLGAAKLPVLTAVLSTPLRQ